MISVGEPTGGSSASVFAVADPSGSEMNAHVASTRSRPLARVGLCESGVAKKGAGSTNARGPIELLRGTWAFQLWHFTERRRWWGRRHVSGGLEWCHRQSRPDDESVTIVDPPLNSGGALNGSLRSSSVLVARSSWCEGQCKGQVVRAKWSTWSRSEDPCTTMSAPPGSSDSSRFQQV